MKKTYDNTIPNITAKQDNRKVARLDGKEWQPPKKCRLCTVTLLEGKEYYQPTPSVPNGYTHCKLCYNTKKHYRAQWKDHKGRITKEVRRYSNIDSISERREVFRNIFRNGGFYNPMDQ